MVKIVTGSINSLKTTRIINYYEDNPIGDGFVSKKIMKDNLVYGYNLMQLSTKHEIPLVIRDSLWDGKKRIIFKIGPYCFFEEALMFLEEKTDEFINNNINPIFLDEIGILELNGEGFDQILKKLIKNKCDLFLVVRSDLLDKVCERYGFKEIEII